MAAQNQGSNVSNPSNQQQTSSSTQMTQRPSALPQRRGSYFPGFAITPQELFSSNPFSLFRRITQDMDRMFQGFGLERSSGGGAGAWSPAIEVFERDGKYHVCAELPGLSPDDIKVEVANDVLTIQGERKSEHEEKQGNLQRTEREYGSFFRTVPLPEGADIEHANAKFENGLLEVAVPVPQQKENRRSIPIQGQAKGREGTQAKAA
jgi:HSP20 family protein